MKVCWLYLIVARIALGNFFGDWAYSYKSGDRMEL